ncbi:MAG: AAA family ATPase [Desulfuromonadales bacterium]|nr:AAA family ATPase [Desulfuromonadales bacterium]MDT8423182.1 AAA family ATPase [Desulfuromonadales bacterium]
MSLPRHALITKTIDILVADFLQGKIEALRLAMTALLAGGHLLLEDIPGLGKTTLALALSGALGLSFGRVQCTSDLLPSDITGLSIFDREKNAFKFMPGPIFNNLLLVDEINRATPKTQSALLEAMEERRVTIEGTTHNLPDPFLVIATQNPLEQVGTYPLPESQMDRFLITTGVGYPPPAIEKEIIRAGSIREEIRAMHALLTLDDILTARRFIHEEIQLGDRVLDYIHTLIVATRDHEMLLSGISTRGGIAIADAARAAAYLRGRAYVIPEDVREMILPVGAHRLIPRAEHETLGKREVLQSIVAARPVPLA